MSAGGCTETATDGQGRSYHCALPAGHDGSPIWTPDEPITVPIRVWNDDDA